MKKNTIIYILALLLSILFINVQAAETGIKVHGHWKLDIYHADGSFDRTVEFENSLKSVGAEQLVSLLSKNKSVAFWRIYLSGGSASPCKDSLNQPSDCIINEVGDSISFPYTFNNLTLINNNNKLTLNGSITTATGISNPLIAFVSTYIQLCDLVSNPNCTNLGLNFVGFTSKLINPNVSLQAGQVVQVTVEISFS